MIPHTPDVLYDLASRIQSLQAVACYIPDAIPAGRDADERRASSIAMGLANAVIDLLTLCEQDVEKLECEIRGIDPPSNPA